MVKVLQRFVAIAVGINYYNQHPGLALWLPMSDAICDVRLKLSHLIYIYPRVMFVVALFQSCRVALKRGIIQ